MNDGSAMQFWLFTIRVAANNNTSLPKLKELFVRYSGCMPAGEIAAGTNVNSLFGSNSAASKKI